ncbi:MAG: SDR family oxidoreductase [Spirochaetaceae bacterium]
MDLGLKNKVFMVAGAGRGLGYGIAQALAREGAMVSIGSRTRESILSAAETIGRETGSTARGYVLDMKDGGSIQRWVEETLTEFGTLDGVVVNAGGPPPGKFEDFDENQWQEAFELTLLSAIRLIRESLEPLKERGGAILTLTSISVREPVDNLILSNVMRSGVVSMVKSLSKEFAPYGIRVNNIIPGFFDTDRLKSLDKNQAERTGMPLKEVIERRKSSVPLGRYGDPKEFGNAAAFLLSDAAGYTTGHSFVLDGGFMKSLS